PSTGRWVAIRHGLPALAGPILVILRPGRAAPGTGPGAAGRKSAGLRVSRRGTEAGGGRAVGRLPPAPPPRPPRPLAPPSPRPPAVAPQPAFAADIARLNARNPKDFR